MKRRARLSLGLFLGLCAWALLFELFAPATVVEDRDLQALASWLRPQLEEGDALLLLPAYLETARPFLPEGLEVMSLPLEALAAEPDLDRPQRLWVLASSGAIGGQVAEGVHALDTRFGKAKLDHNLGALRLLRYKVDALRPSFLLSEELESATVTANGAPCPFRPRGEKSPRFQCREAPWTYVGAQIRGIGGIPRRCVWAHPLGGGRTLSIRVPTRGPLSSLELRAGFVGNAAYLQEASSVELALRYGGNSLGSVSVLPKPGWQQRKIAIPSAERVGDEPIEIELRSDNPGQRHLCFELLGYSANAARVTPVEGSGGAS